VLVTKETGIEVETVVFDSDGQVVGVPDEILDSVAGGLMIEDDCNGACGNTANGVNCK
jgi:hypothetical protein